MGVDSVHRVLLDLFPQIDRRVLRAVAFAHAKDADAAVEAVLEEVIPSLSQKLAKSDVVAVDAAAMNQPLDSKKSDEVVDESLYYVEKGENSRSRNPDISSYSDSSGESEDEEASSLQKSRSKTRSDEVSAASLLSLSLEQTDADPSGTAHCENSKKLMAVVDGPSHQEQLSELSFPLETISQECIEVSQGSSIQLLLGPDTQANELVKAETSSTNAASDIELFTGEKDDLKAASTMNTMVCQSTNICNIDLLEDLITEARNNKKILVSSMDLVVSLSREVEIQEKAAEEAKEEATRGYLDMQVKVQELKEALQRAKEANDMHAGEVHAEKAVLITEAKELQSRLLSLSEERDRSLRILDEMREALEERLSASAKVIKEAEMEKLEREASAREALAFQERIMEQVVQEARALKEEAEENSKLQDFLMDRGRIVDMLQGEISVKCQDVRLLKEKFDSHVPLSTSLFSSQTTSILGSSSSSSRSRLSPDRVPELTGSNVKLNKGGGLVDTYEKLEKNSELDSYRTSVEGAQGAEPADASTSKMPSANEHISAGEEAASGFRKVVLDNGWEWDLFDGDED